MHKVVTINLNGQAYQFDEDAYEAIRAYLARAEEQLRDNPDRAEILSDLEQAIAESSPRGAKDSAAAAGERPRSDTAPRRLYRMQEGAMIGGLCNGIAAFFGIDVALMRVAFAVVAAIELAASHVGIMLIAYVVMMLVVPMAGTAQPRTIQRSRVASSPAQLAASAASLDAPDAVSVAMAIMAAVPPSADYGTPVVARVMTSVLAVASLCLFLASLYGLIALLATGGIHTWRVPENIWESVRGAIAAAR
jgi:phage shock protein PspC (stress-responsive transcriptional regulator)